MEIHSTGIHEQGIQGEIMRTGRTTWRRILVVVIPSGGTRSKYNVTTMENIILYSKHSALTGVEVDCIRTRTASVASIVVELQRHRARHANAFKAAVARCGTIDDVLLIG